MRRGAASAGVLPITMLALGSALAGGCEYDRSAFYGTGGGAAGTGAVIEIPLPVLPDEEVRDACRGCVAQECAAARDACLEDDACTALLSCKGSCDNPSCLADCEADFGFSAWYDDLWICTFKQCAEECRTGQNWGCVDAYDRTPGESLIDLELRFTPPESVELGGGHQDNYLVGSEVRACRGEYASCEAATASAVLDDSQSVDLRVGTFLGIFNGYFEIEGSDVGFPARERIYLEPVSRSAEVRVWVFQRRLIAGFGRWFEMDGFAQVAAYPLDCAGTPAAGVRVEIVELPGAEVWHFQGMLLGAQFDKTTLGFGFVPDIPEEILAEPIRVRAIRVDTGEAIAERSVFGRAGWITHVPLVPRTRRGD